MVGNKVGSENDEMVDDTVRLDTAKLEKKR